MNSVISIFANKDFYWRVMLVLCIGTAMLAACDVAFAAAASSNDIIGTTLCRLVSNLTGGIAKAIATIAIFAVGVGLFMGKLNWGVAAATAAGVGIIFGAGSMVAWLSGSDANSECPTK
jgi:type IV secretory pathway VirB2 component (pilin)